MVGHRVTGPLGALRSRYEEAELAVAPAAVIVGVLPVVFAAKDGGYAETVWLPGALVTTALLAIACWFLRPVLGRPRRLAVVGLASFTAVLGASIAWADVKGDAWLGADRALFYLLLFTLCSLLPWRPRTATLALGIFGVGATAVGVWQFLRVVRYPVLHHDFFVAGRLATPISYSNGDCALFVMAALPLLLLAARREVPVLARGVFLASSCVAAELAVLCQSRISLLAVPIVAVLVLAATGERVRVLLTAVPVLVALGLASSTLVDVYTAVLDGPAASELASARRAVLVSAVVLLVVGWAGAAVDARFAPSPRVRRALSAAAVGVVVAAVAGALVVGGRIAPHPISFVRVQWDSFVSGSGYTDVRVPHFQSAGTNRYDIWRVAFDQFTGSPIVGIGADNFAAPYLRERRSASESPLYPHSDVLMVLSQTGVVGAAAFLVFLVGVGAALGRVLGRPGPRAAAALAAAAPAAYFLLHGAGDWFWELPAVGAAGMAFLGVAAALSRATPAAAGRRTPRVVVLVGAVVAATLFALPWVAAREVALASSGWPADPGLAYDRLRVAARLNPLSDVPAETEGLIAARSGDDRRARDAFARAVARNGVNWYSRLELGVMEARLGRRGAALAELRRAGELNPREAIVGRVRSRIARRGTVTQELVDRLLAQENLS